MQGGYPKWETDRTDNGVGPSSFGSLERPVLLACDHVDGRVQKRHVVAHLRKGAAMNPHGSVDASVPLLLVRGAGEKVSQTGAGRIPLVCGSRRGVRLPRAGRFRGHSTKLVASGPCRGQGGTPMCAAQGAGHGSAGDRGLASARGCARGGGMPPARGSAARTGGGASLQDRATIRASDAWLPTETQARPR